MNTSQQYYWFVGCARAQAVIRRPPMADIGFSTPGHMGFMVDKVAVGQAFLQVLLFSLVSIMLQMLHTHSFTYH